MIGMVLAAGAGKRLGSLTEDLPKTLLEVDGDRTILDVALGNFAAVGLEEAVIVAPPGQSTGPAFACVAYLYSDTPTRRGGVTAKTLNRRTG